MYIADLTKVKHKILTDLVNDNLLHFIYIKKQPITVVTDCLYVIN